MRLAVVTLLFASVGALRVTDVVMQTRVEVCRNKYCGKRGSKATLELCQELAGEGLLVSEVDMSHTEHGCFDECTMGPNVRIGGAGPQTDSAPFGEGRVINGVKGREAVEELLAQAAKL